MAFVPDKAILNYWRLKPAEVRLYDYVCMVRNHERGGWEIDDYYAAEQLHLSRNRVYEARKSLESKGWIKIMYSVSATRHFIAPFFGFFVENSTENHDSSTKSVEDSTLPLKELPAPIPAQFTREGANDFAPPAQPDEKSKSQSAGKPAVAAPTTKRKRRRSSAPRPPARRKPTGITIDHPAVQMIQEITGRFPNKDLWNRISKEIGDKPKKEFFRKSFEKWRSFDGNPMNYEQWLFEPNATGNVPETYGANGNGNGSGKPVDVPKYDPTATEKPLDEKGRNEALIILRDLLDFDGDVSKWRSHYLPDDWAWLMENLQK